MRYRVALEIPADTSESSPERQDIKAWRGVISRINIFFPAGCSGLVHVRIRQAKHNIAPVNPDGWFNGDDEGPDYQEHYPLKSGTNVITIEGYNEDTTYSHTPIVEFDVLPEDVLTMPRLQYDLIYAFARALEAMNRLMEKMGAT